MPHTDYLVVNLSYVSGRCKNIGSKIRHFIYTGPFALSAHLVGLSALFVLVAHNLVLFNWMFYKLVCLEQTTSIRCLCPHLTMADY